MPNTCAYNQVIRAVSGIENISVDCHTSIIDDEWFTCTPQTIKSNRHSWPNFRVFTHRVRDREPSIISLRKVMQSLKCKILRRKLKKVFSKKWFPGHEIAPYTGANVTKFFTLVTKSWKLVAKLATRMFHHNLPRDIVN